MAQLMPLPLTVSCFSKIQIGLPFWYRLTWLVPDKGLLNGCVCVCVCVFVSIYTSLLCGVIYIMNADATLCKRFLSFCYIYFVNSVDSCILE